MFEHFSGTISNVEDSEFVSRRVNLLFNAHSYKLPDLYRYLNSFLVIISPKYSAIIVFSARSTYATTPSPLP